ncbi:MAG: hypothetical protein WBD78_00060 [Methylocella sp.]
MRSRVPSTGSANALLHALWIFGRRLFCRCRIHSGGSGHRFSFEPRISQRFGVFALEPPCVYYGRTLDHPGKLSYFFGLRLEYWGYGLFAFGVLDAYLSWNSLAHDWLAAV